MRQSDAFFQYPLNKEHPYSTHDPLEEKRALRPQLDEEASHQEDDNTENASLTERVLRNRRDG